MRRRVLARGHVLAVPFLALATLAAPPLTAQEAVPAPEDEGFSLMEEGAKLILRGMMSEMEPAFDEMGKALKDAEPMLKEIGPQFAALMELMGDVRNYEPPEVLPNGDILIRRKPGAPVSPLTPEQGWPGGPTLPGPNGEIEL
ncbi:MAG: hypothetical protein R3D63_01335 [Paracoccaceae bacterium]